MAVINIYDTPFSTTPHTFNVDEKSDINNILNGFLENYSEDSNIYECYNIETGETTYITEETESYKAVIIVNDKEQDLSYIVSENDVIIIMLIPQGKNAGATVLEFLGMGMVVAGTILTATGIAAPLGVALIVTGLGLQLYAAWELAQDMSQNPSSREDALKSEKNLSINGCGNQDITDHVFPMVIGKHLQNPYVIGSPFCTTYTKNLKGEDGGQYVTALYCAGYSPLKLSNFRIDQTYLSYNRDKVMHGQLHGFSDGSTDNGDILHKWKNNDVTLEILQYGEGSNDDIYGKLYPQVVEQIEPKANLIRIKDSLIQELGNKIYKGTSVPNGFMTNSVRFSGSCPQRLEVELDFQNGLYAQRSKEGKLYYYNLPVRLAVQWRFVKKGQESSNAQSSSGWNNFDYILLKGSPTSGENHIPPHSYTFGKKLFDYQSERGQSKFYSSDGKDIPSGSNGYFNKNDRNQLSEFRNDGWLYSNLFEFGTENCSPVDDNHNNSITDSGFSPKDFKENYGVNQRRYVVVKNFTDEECRKMIGYQKDGSGNSYADIDSVEVRVLRINPSYMDEVGDKESDGYQNMSYQDLVKWDYLRTFSFDKRAYEEALNNYRKANPGISIANIPNGAVPVANYPLRPLSKEDMKKFCVIALTLKQDVAETGGSSLKKMDVITEAFAPKYNLSEDKWYPEKIEKEYKYFETIKDTNVNGEPVDRIVYFEGTQRYQKQQYEEALNQGRKVDFTKNGNNFVTQLKELIFSDSNLSNGNGSTSVSTIKRYLLPQSVEDKYISNNSASGTILSLVGGHLGKEAKTYNELNMESFTEFYKFCEDVTDKSLDDNGNLRHYRFTCNGIVNAEIKLETLLQKVILTGRSAYRLDDENRYEVVIGKANKYPVMMINQQNCLGFSNNRDFNDRPSGFHCQFIDETDNYSTNDVYVMMDGEDYKRPTKDVEELSIPYVTNREQLWSLARSNLGARVYQRESYTRTIGKIGYSLSYGDVVLLQDATLLVGTDNGGRIREIIQDNEKIYGFTVNEPFHYKGEETFEGSGLCTQGVTILQPQKTGASRCVTLRLAMPDKEVTVVSAPEDTENRTKLQTKVIQIKSKDSPTGWVDAPDELYNMEHTYRMKRGLTNVVLFDAPVSRITYNSSDLQPVQLDDKTISINVIPKVDNLVAFGMMNFITIKAIVSAIKPQEKDKFQITLVPYDDSLYEMGGVMPKFNSKMTQPSEEMGNVFQDAVSKDDVTNIAVNTATGSVSNIIKIVETFTSLYSLEVSPEFQSIAVTSTGELVSKNYVYIKAQLLYNAKNLTFDSLGENESLKYKAFINNKEVGEWLLTDEYKDEIVENLNYYDGSPVVRIPVNIFKDSSNIVTVYAEHKKGDDTNSKTETVSVGRISYGDSPVWYDMAFPSGQGVIKRSVKRDKDEKFKYLPKRISAEKRMVLMEDGETQYKPTEYGTITARYYDKDGNLINSEEDVDNNKTVGGYSPLPNDKIFDEEETYYRKFNPIFLSLGKEEDGSLIVLGFGQQDSGLNEDIPIVFYERD